MTRSEHAWVLPAIAALVVWGFWAFLPKLALQSLPPHNVIFYESLGNFIITVPILFLLRFKVEFEKKTVAQIAGTAALTVCAILCYFLALRHGPVAVIATMTALYPIICLILARVFLKERVNGKQIVAIIMAMCSILLLALP